MSIEDDVALLERVPTLRLLGREALRVLAIGSEHREFARGDTLFRLVPSEKASVVGMRYDLASFAAVKLEYRNVARPGQPRVNGAFAQTSFVF